MTNEKQLREERAGIWNQMQDLQKRALAEKRELTADESAQWDRIDAKFNSLTSAIDGHMKMSKRAAIMADEAENVLGGGKKDATPEEKKAKYRGLFEKFLKRGQMSREDLAYLKRGTATQVVGTTTLGGFLVPEGFEKTLIETMADFSGMLEAAFLYPTLTGQVIKVPTVDDTGSAATIVGEGVARTVADVTFGSKTLESYTLASLARASEEFLQDSAFNSSEMFNYLFAQRFGRGLNTQATVGTGSSQANGILTASSAGLTAAATAAITRDEILDLLHSVDPAYRRSAKAGFMLNDSTLKAIKKMAIGSGDDRPLWQASIRDGEPDTIEGFKYYINQDFESLAAAKKVMAFGDWNKYWIRISKQMTMRQLNERFADEFEVGFIAAMRIDGELMDTAAIKHLITAAS